MIPSEPPNSMIKLGLVTAAHSTCRSQRGVVVYMTSPGIEWIVASTGYNGPPAPLSCPGREICAGTCGRRSVHAEMRALRGLESGPAYELVHVELAADGGVVACDGPGCWQCSREILDCGFIAGVWLYERILTMEARPEEQATLARWRRYTAEAFHRETLKRCGLVP